MTANELHRCVVQGEANRDSTFIAHHLFEARCTRPCLDIRDQQTKSLPHVDHKMGRLQTNRRDHGVLWPQVLLDDVVHCLFRWAEQGADDPTKCLLCSNYVDVMVDVLWMQ